MLIMVHYNPHVTRYALNKCFASRVSWWQFLCRGCLDEKLHCLLFGWDMGWQSSKWPTKVAKWVTNQDSNKDVSITRVHSSTQGF